MKKFDFNKMGENVVHDSNVTWLFKVFFHFIAFCVVQNVEESRSRRILWLPASSPKMDQVFADRSDGHCFCGDDVPDGVALYVTFLWSHFSCRFLTHFCRSICILDCQKSHGRWQTFLGLLGAFLSEFGTWSDYRYETRANSTTTLTLTFRHRFRDILRYDLWYERFIF